MADAHADAQASPGTDGQPGGQAGEADQPEGCRLCEIVPAVLGLIAAGVIVFVSLDLIKGGALTVRALRVASWLGIGGRPRDDDSPAD